MGQQVGGLMSADEVGQAFLSLLETGVSGDVMSLWKDCPPYFIPDTSMGLFIAFTTCAMMFRYVPKSLTPNSLRAFPHFLGCILANILLMFVLYKALF